MTLKFIIKKTGQSRVITIDDQELCTLEKNCDTMKSAGITGVTRGENNLFFLSYLESETEGNHYLVMTSLDGENMKVIHKYTSVSGDGSNIEYLAIANTIYYLDSDGNVQGYSVTEDKTRVVEDNGGEAMTRGIRYDGGYASTLHYINSESSQNESTYNRYLGDNTFQALYTYKDNEYFVHSNYVLEFDNEKVIFKTLDEKKTEFDVPEGSMFRPEMIVATPDLIFIPYQNQETYKVTVIMYRTMEEETVKFEEIDRLEFDDDTGISFVANESTVGDVSIQKPYTIVFSSQVYDHDNFEFLGTRYSFTSAGFEGFGDLTIIE